MVMLFLNDDEFLMYTNSVMSQKFFLRILQNDR